MIGVLQTFGRHAVPVLSIAFAGRDRVCIFGAELIVGTDKGIDIFFVVINSSQPVITITGIGFALGTEAHCGAVAVLLHIIHLQGSKGNSFGLHITDVDAFAAEAGSDIFLGIVYGHGMLYIKAGIFQQKGFCSAAAGVNLSRESACRGIIDCCLHNRCAGEEHCCCQCSDSKIFDFHNNISFPDVEIIIFDAYIIAKKTLLHPTPKGDFG